MFGLDDRLSALPDSVQRAAEIGIGMAHGIGGSAGASGPAQRRFTSLAPGLGSIALLFGAWYALGATGAVPYVF